jgi:hypothetical protein
MIIVSSLIVIGFLIIGRCLSVVIALIFFSCLIAAINVIAVSTGKVLKSSLQYLTL